MLGTTLYEDVRCDKLINELVRFAPVEIALGGSGIHHKKIDEYIQSLSGTLTFTYDAAEVLKGAGECLAGQLKNSADITEYLLKISSEALI